MSDILEKYEQDILFFLSKMPDASEAYQDDFAEIVSSLMKMDGKTEEVARCLALARLEQRRWGNG